MELSNLPTKFPIPWANSAVSPYIRPIPTNSQIGIQGGAASLVDGYPPLTFTPESAGGVPPWGADTNGILNQITAWTRWYNAGGPIAWDSGFSAAISGYPKGAVVASTVTDGLLWRNLVDDNTTNPDDPATAANWVQAGRIKLSANTTFYIATTGNDTTGTGAVGAPWATITRASAVLASMYDFNGYQVTLQLADGTYTPANLTMTTRFVGQVGPIIINGNASTPTTVIYRATLAASNGGWFQVQNMRMGGGSTANCLITSDGGFIYTGPGMSYDAVSSDHLHTGGGGTINILNSYSIVGGAANHMNGLNGGNIGVSGGVTITLSNTPAFTEFLNLGVLAQFFGSPAFAGTGATGQKYNITNNSVAFTSGVNFPGNSAGTTASGGQFS